MAKRFTDTDKWKKSFIKGMPAEYKLFWLYLLDECNHAGIWHVEFDLVQLRLGIQVSETKARGFFKERVVLFDAGTKWFIPDFIEFQYGKLGSKNRAHNSVIEQLTKYDLLRHLPQYLLEDSLKEENQERGIKPLISPLQGAMDKDKDKDTHSIIDEKGGMGEKTFADQLRENEGIETRFNLKPKIPTKQQVWECFVRNNGTKEMAKKFWDEMEATGWYRKGSPVRNFAAIIPGWVTTWKEIESGRKGQKNGGNIKPDARAVDVHELLRQRQEEIERDKANSGQHV